MGMNLSECTFMVTLNISFLNYYEVLLRIFFFFFFDREFGVPETSEVVNKS